MTSFIFVRHGKSQANKDHMVGNADSPLTKQGQTQARKTARALKNRGIVHIVCSPYLRTRQTAEIIAKELKIADISVMQELHERGFGELTGKPRDHEPEWYAMVDGEYGMEPRQDILRRVQVALQKIQQLGKDGTVLVVCHAVSGYFLQQVAAGKRSLAQFGPAYEPKNAEPTDVTIVPVRSRLPFLLGVAGGALVAMLVAVWLLWPRPQPVPERPQKDIPMTLDDFNESPNLQGAVQKQIEQQQQRTGTPQAQSGNAAQLLQPGSQAVPSP